MLVTKKPVPRCSFLHKGTGQISRGTTLVPGSLAPGAHMHVTCALRRRLSFPSRAFANRNGNLTCAAPMRISNFCLNLRGLSAGDPRSLTGNRILLGIFSAFVIFFSNLRYIVSVSFVNVKRAGKVFTLFTAQWSPEPPHCSTAREHPSHHLS